MSVVVLISGRGSNMQALLDANIPVAAVISNRADAAGLQIAAERGVPTEVLSHKAYPSREEFDRALAARVAAYEPRVIALAGFMRVLSAAFVERFAGSIVNIHPSLLPCFPGLDTHERALAAGVKVHGCTAHLVTAELDHGPIIAQAAVAVQPDDDAAKLAARVLRQEHRIFPLALRWLLEDRLIVEKGVVRVKGSDAQFMLGDRV
jgi:phosphoribosylglycinamide formyltransferase-1